MRIRLHWKEEEEDEVKALKPSSSSCHSIISSSFRLRAPSMDSSSEDDEEDQEEAYDYDELFHQLNFDKLQIKSKNSNRISSSLVQEEPCLHLTSQPKKNRHGIFLSEMTYNNILQYD
jgi:hypothetical protein